MNYSNIKKFLFYFLITFPFLSFLLGLFLSLSNENFSIAWNIFFLCVLLALTFYILFIRQKQGDVHDSRIVGLYGTFICINLLFCFSIGFTIPLMESISRVNMGIVMIPLLTVLNAIILKQFNYRNMGQTIEDNSKEKDKGIQNKKKLPVIEFEGKKYSFTVRSLVVFAIGAPLLAWFTYFLFDLQVNYWLHEIVVKQTVFVLNLLFNMGVKGVYYPVGKYQWYFSIPGRPNIYFETFCTGIQAINVFVGIILFIPHSLNKENNEDIIWRKTKALVISSVIFYFVNILRMVIQLYLYYIGYAWDDIHVSISAASSFIAAIIVLLLHRWIPEFIISIIFAGTLIYRRLKAKSKEEEIKTNSSE